MAELGRQFLKKFVRQVCISIKKQESTHINKDDIKDQLDRVKYAALKAKKRWLIEKEIQSLENMVDTVGKSVNTEIQQLRKEIEELQSKLSSDNYSAVDNGVLEEINEKLDLLIENKMRRERLDVDMEQKFLGTSEKKRHLNHLAKRLNDIKKRHTSLKRKKSNKRLSEIEKKIKALSSRVKQRK